MIPPTQAGRQFPVIGTDRKIIESVPWAFLAPHAQQAIKNHSQTLERLAERGGLALCEIHCIVHHMSFPTDWGAKQYEAAGRAALHRLGVWMDGYRAALADATTQ